MSLTFNDCLANDLAYTFLNTNEFAVSVSVTRGAATTTGVAAIVAARSYDRVGDDIVVTSIQSWDFDIIATVYQISSARVDPQVGDRITDSTNAVFEVMPIPGAQCFEPTDGDGKLIRVHTKRIKT